MPYPKKYTREELKEIRHKRSVAREANKCYSCQQKFNTLSELKQHQRDAHGFTS